jgi:hypothetical protein
MHWLVLELLEYEGYEVPVILLDVDGNVKAVIQ